MKISLLKSIGWYTFAFFVGLIVLSLLFSDLSPGETITRRLMTASLFLLVSGLLIGYFNQARWIISVTAAWSGILIGFIGLINGEEILQSAGLLFLSPGLSLLSGFLGSLASRKRLFHRPR